MNSFVAEVIVSFFLVTGAFLTFLGSLGIVKLPDYYARLHGPAKNTTLGLGGILVASAIFFSVTQQGLTIREILITLFLFLTAPISAHLMAKAALHLDLEFVDRHADDEDDEIYHPSERMADD
ncbi:MAG: Na+/H+ antiporter subunit G [Bradymonadaceae bacterium]